MNTTLYKLDTKGKMRSWQIEVHDLQSRSEIHITTGLLDGKKHTEIIGVTEGKNIGRSNETTHYTQALSEAQSRVDLQLRAGYVENSADAKQNTLGSGIPAPMLAHKFHPTGLQSNSKTLDQMKLTGVQVAVQPKLDGNRCLIVCPAFSRPVMYTRKGDKSPVQLEHILNDVEKLRVEKGFVSNDIILDGELFSTTMPFNEMNGLLKKIKGKPSPKLKEIRYHIYDIIDNSRRYMERLEYVRDYACETVIPVTTVVIEAQDYILTEYLTRFLVEGYEGLMIRRLDVPYENKRSWSLLKYKTTEDAEFKLVGMEEDARGGFIGAFIMELPEPVRDRDGNILTTFKAGVSNLTQDEGRAMLNEQEKYLGKMATVEYFALSEYGVPRFPKLLRFREDM